MAGDVVWITGASSGIGRALALRLAGDGDTVAVSARSRETLEELAREAAGRRGRIMAYPLDVTERDDVATTVDRIEGDLGPIEQAVLAAGTHHPISADAFLAQDLARLVEVNLLGVANALEPLMRTMIGRRRGRIAIVSSVAGYRGLPTSAYYGASKAALINLAESLKFDLDRHGVQMQLINPGFVETPLTDKNPFPMPFLIGAETAAERIAKGLRGSSFEISFPRRFTWLLKVMRCLPYLLYFPLVARTTGR
jgi:NAD(P)-dependent dehydrogenase (short-subunit alcohol dehydrogenase family)